MRQHLKPILLGVLLVPALPALILLLPIVLLAIMVGDVFEARRLARTRCEACGTAIGRAEVLRARAEARANGMALVRSALARGVSPRIPAVTWQVTCPTCGRGYLVPQSARRRVLVAKA